jgi:hypothetical protein
MHHFGAALHHAAVENEGAGARDASAAPAGGAAEGEMHPAEPAGCTAGAEEGAAALFMHHFPPTLHHFGPTAGFRGPAASSGGVAAGL